MNVEDAEENVMDFHYFCGCHFFIRSQDIYAYFCDNYVSSLLLDKDLQMSSLSMHHVDKLPL